jgi:peptidoglycan/xylan/chitin deacetylase (PgdA/CDA1 family)
LLAFAAFAAARRGPRSPLAPILLPLPEPTASPVASSPLAAHEPGRGERSGADQVLHLGLQSPRGVLDLGALPAGHGAPGLTLWPPAPLWPSSRGGRLLIEHGLLAPSSSYRLDLAWADGTSWTTRFDTAPLPELLARGPAAERVDPASPVWFRFGAEVNPASVEAAFRMEPPVSGSFRWDSPTAGRFLPSRHLSYGTLYRVTLGGQTRDGAPLLEASWSFRPLIPPPARVAPGEGAPAVFTFDDGTNDMPQAWELLDLLRKHEVKAILFPTGRWARAHPDFIERALQDGHRLCNHSDTHARLPLLPDEPLRREILRGAGHGSCDLLRPPSMALSKRVEQAAAALGYRIFLWDVDSRDWEGLYAEDIINRVLARMRPGAVLLFHMHGAHTLEALPRLFQRLRAEGYSLTHEGADRIPGLPGEASEAPRDRDTAPDGP